MLRSFRSSDEVDEMNYFIILLLGPEQGYTQSICNPHHALLCAEAWEKFLDNPGPIVVGTTPGASCFGPAYEFAMLMRHTLKQQGLLDLAPITFVTSEPYAGHMGIGGMADSRWLIRKLMAEREIELGNRRRAITLTGFWVSWLKLAFEKYFLIKMRWGWTIPWFERWGFRAIGLPLVEPISTDIAIPTTVETVN